MTFKKVMRYFGIYSCLVTVFLLCSGAVFAGERVYYYHNDPAGTPMAMTNSTRAVVWKADYKPFGEEQSVTGTIENNEKFVGKEKDKETGLYYFGARYLLDKIGRFVSVDPVGPVDGNGKVNNKMLLNPQRLNRYAYALNNPYRYVDPDGREVRLTGHIAATPLGKITSPSSYHLGIVLMPDSPQDFTNRSGWKVASDGKISATLGGQCCKDSSLLDPLGKLQSAPNYAGDSLANGTFSQVVPTPKGMTDTQFISGLINAANSYGNDLNYDATPSKDGGYNSNSYVSGVLGAAGAKPPALNTGGKFQAPGYNKPIPLP